MPNVWCHLLIGGQFVKDLPDDIKKDINNGPNRPVFRLGCLGPDFFLFHGWSRLYYKSRHEVSSVMHRYHCKESLIYSIERVKSEKKRGKPWWSLAIYCLGTVSHFVVDTTIHPLVYAIVPKSKPNKDMHVKLEVEMDLYLANGLGLPCEKIFNNPSANLIIPRHATYEICRYYYDIVNTIYKDELKPISRGRVLEALQDYLDIFEILRARGVLYKLAKGLAHLSFGTLRLDWFWHPTELSPNVEQLLDDGNFWGLCDEAIEIGQKLLPMIWAYWHDEETIENIYNAMPKKSYLGRKEL